MTKACVEERALQVTEESAATVATTAQVGEVYQRVFGTADKKLANHLTRQLLLLMPNAEDTDQALALSLALEKAIQPKDELEALLSAQMAGVHNLAMKFLGRANSNELPTEGVTLNVERATKLLRTFTAQMEALNRYRGKGQQKVTVEHVTVNQGGQAVIGVVERPRGAGGSTTTTDDVPHAARKDTGRQ